MEYKERWLTKKKRQFIQDYLIDYLADRITKKEIQVKFEKKFKVTDNSFYNIWRRVGDECYYNNYRKDRSDFSVNEDDLKGLHQMPKNWQLLKYKDELTIADYE